MKKMLSINLQTIVTAIAVLYTLTAIQNSILAEDRLPANLKLLLVNRKNGDDPQPNPPNPSPKPKDDTPTLTLPSSLTVKPDRYFFIQATATNCKTIKWCIPKGLDNSLSSLLNDPTKQILIGDIGVYSVQAVGSSNDVITDIAACTITIGTPTPPIPPPPPTPIDPLATTLIAAYAKDTGSDRATSLQYLQGVYSGMASIANSWTDVKTVGDAFNKMKLVVDQSAANPSGLTADKVKNLRTAIANELTSVFGTTATTPITLTALTVEITKIANALSAVK